MPRLIALLLATLFLGDALADSGSKSFGDYTVYYASMRSDDLTPEIARTYGITRGRERAVLLINVQKSGAMSAASVSGRARNLLGHARPLAFREVREQNSVDYLAELPVRSGELLIFDIAVQPPSTTTPLQLQFRQTFYTD